MLKAAFFPIHRGFRRAGFYRNGCGWRQNGDMILRTAAAILGTASGNFYWYCGCIVLRSDTINSNDAGPYPADVSVEIEPIL